MILYRFTKAEEPTLYMILHHTMPNITASYDWNSRDTEPRTVAAYVGATYHRVRPKACRIQHKG